MNALRLVAAFSLTVAICVPVVSNASTQVTQTSAPDTVVANGAQAATPSADTPRLTIGVSDPNTRLILPWFLNDIVNAINTRASPDEFVHSVGHDL